MGVATFPVTGAVKVPAVLVAVAVIYVGIDRMAKTLISPRFDTGLWMSTTWLVLIIGATTIADILPLGISSDTTKGGYRPNIPADPALLGTDNPLHAQRRKLYMPA